MPELSPYWLYAIPAVLTWRFVCNGTRGAFMVGFLFALIWPLVLVAIIVAFAVVLVLATLQRINT